MLKISFIIPSFNQGQFLAETLESLINQDYKNIEIIVMDGGSTDNSVEIIKKYEKHITYWQSQKDNGQSDAINSGFRKATGDFVTWLNSDDVILSGAISKVVKCMEAHPSANFFMGNLFWMDKEGYIIHVGKSGGDNHFCQKHYLFANGGPSAFMRRTTLIDLGMLREDFHYMMDTELWCRFIKSGHYFVRLPFYCWCLRIHENAKMSGHNVAGSQFADMSHPSWKKKQREQRIIDETYYSPAWLMKAWRFSKLLTWNYYSRFFDRKYLNVHYKDIIA